MQDDVHEIALGPFHRLRHEEVVLLLLDPGRKSIRDRVVDHDGQILQDDSASELATVSTLHKPREIMPESTCNLD